MTAFELTRAAKKDLRNIATFTEKRWNRNQRYLYMKQFNDVFHFLAENPFAGKKCDSIKPGYKKFPQGSHVIFYRDSTKSKITIIRILHKNMDAESQFSGTSRGRNARYRAPPAQTRTCSFSASGSSVVLAFARAITVARYMAQIAIPFMSVPSCIPSPTCPARCTFEGYVMVY